MKRKLEKRTEYAEIDNQKQETFFLKTYNFFHDKCGADIDYICQNDMVNPKDAIRRFLCRYNAGIMTFIFYFGAWQQNRQIFQISNELKEEVFASSDSLDNIPGEVLERIPYDSFYVEAPFNGYDGFIVRQDKETKIINILMIGSLMGAYRCMTYRIDTSLTVKEQVRSITRKKSDLTQKKKVGGFDDIKIITTNSFTIAELSEEFKKVLSLLLYICSENADIKPVEEVKKIEKSKKLRREKTLTYSHD